MRESGAALEWVFGGEGDGGSRSPVPHPAGSGPSAAPGAGASVPGCRAKAPHSFGQSSVWTRRRSLLWGLCVLGGGLQASLGALAVGALACLSFSQVWGGFCDS